MTNKDAWAEKRKAMVEFQLIERGIKDVRVLEAMQTVPRHEFIPKEFISESYADHPLPVGEGQTISQPYMVALMTEALELKGKEKVLEVGTGSGYQAALLGKLARRVITIEKKEPLAEKAREALKKLGYENVEVVVEDGTEGYKKEAPFDAIIVTGGAPDIPSPLVDQLKEGGRIVIPIGNYWLQTLYKIKKVKGQFLKQELCDCMFVPLIGKFGWKREE
ncbi:MAG: protein-L-isoaspartate(D-aspartate) O-methyltransferase [Nanoarchaeota archaeon]|nr:protein-L-isoaspartate(D-aspartate) O-methyltransferase [Nanoarchaeota archaeon]